MSILVTIGLAESYMRLSIDSSNKYQIFLEFIEKFSEGGFENIDPEDPTMKVIDHMMEENNQFFYVGNILEMRMIYVSKKSLDIFGIEPEKLEPGIIFTNTMPEDLDRHSITRSRLFKLASDLFISEDEYAIMSTNLHFLNPEENYSNIMVQGLLFKCKKPTPCVYCIFIQTDISWFGEIKNGYHYYIGNDVSYFRPPDQDLILTGSIFSDREFEILRLIKAGKSSDQIGEHLFLSPHTIDTHRRNILKKTKKATVSELIIELMEQGFF